VNQNQALLIACVNPKVTVNDSAGNWTIEGLVEGDYLVMLIKEGY
jgi:hypothetical protein